MARARDQRAEELLQVPITPAWFAGWSIADCLDPRARTSFCILGGALVVALVLLVPYLDVLPGLHGDEAWVGLRVREIVGARAAAVRHERLHRPDPPVLLLVPILEAFGYLVFLPPRSLTVAMSLLAVVLYHLAASCTATVRRCWRCWCCGHAAVLHALRTNRHRGLALNPCCALLAIGAPAASAG
ncbi:MAG: hypothetical protein U1E76_21215 [Planctomycetota bacterium]